jgi:hypothetical protein
MRQAGVHILDSLGIAMELLRDWRNPPGADIVMQWMNQYVPSYGMLARAHASVVEDGDAEDEVPKKGTR